LETEAEQITFWLAVQTAHDSAAEFHMNQWDVPFNKEAWLEDFISNLQMEGYAS
jgi:hypothetical protein